MTPKAVNPMRTLAIFLTLLIASSALAQDRRDGDRRNRPDRYWAMFRDGTALIGKDLRDWHERNRKPTLNGRALFDDNNPLLILRDTTIQSQLAGPYIEFANGDVLPGRLIGGMPADPSTLMPTHLLVAPTSPILTYDRRTTEIAIKPEHVARVVLTREAKGPLEPGTLFFTDGRKVKVKAVRWTLGGVRGLTDEGSIAAGWIELAEVHPPGVNPMAALLDDALAPMPRSEKGVDAMLGRISTTNGAVLTYRRSMLRHEGEGDPRWSVIHTIQPAWALQVIRVPVDEIVTRSYRNPADLPLSIMPGETLLQKSATGFLWPWRRNANVRGNELVLGSAVGDLGVGTHSYSEIAFDLPQQARQFSATVGINRTVGNGGCAKVKIFRDKAQDKPIWESGFIRGGDSPIKLGPIDVSGAKRLILVTDYGHEGRPRGADPLDIRDEVDWLWPTVTVDLAEAQKLQKQPDLEEIFPSLIGWNVSAEARSRISLRPYWDIRKGRWTLSMFVDATGNDNDRMDRVKPIEVTRKMTITQANSWMLLSASRDDNGQANHELLVLADGKPVDSALNGNVTTGRAPGEYEERYYSFGEYAGKSVTVAVRMSPRGAPQEKPSGLLLGYMTPRPIVANLSESEKTISPQVPLSSLKPVEVMYKESDKKPLVAGKTVDGKPLAILGWNYADGFGMPAGESVIKYALDPAWTKFVAVVGLCDGWQGAGPYEVLLDDEVVWQSQAPPQLGRTDEARQVLVHLPPGHKVLTLRVDKKNQGGAAWADAGFMKD